MGVLGDVSPIFELEGTPCAMSSYFLGLKLKLLPPDVRFFRSKYTKYDFSWGSAPDTTGRAYSVLQAPSWI